MAERRGTGAVGRWIKVVMQATLCFFLGVQELETIFIHSLKLSIAFENMSSQKKIHLPTINFQVVMLVFRGWYIQVISKAPKFLMSRMVGEWIWCLVKKVKAFTTPTIRFNGSCNVFKTTLPKTNMAPENGWLEDYIHFGKDLLSRANC